MRRPCVNCEHMQACASKRVRIKRVHARERGCVRAIMCVRARCVRARVRVHVRVRACVRARACARACVCVCVHVCESVYGDEAHNHQYQHRQDSANVRASPQSQNKMQSGFLLDVIIAKRAAIFKLLARENEALLIWRDAFLILNFSLDIVDGIAGLNLKRDGLARERLDEDLHSRSKTGLADGWPFFKLVLTFSFVVETKMQKLSSANLEL